MHQLQLAQLSHQLVFFILSVDTTNWQLAIFISILTGNWRN
jgi:hypothetical protein